MGNELKQGLGKNLLLRLPEMIVLLHNRQVKFLE